MADKGKRDKGKKEQQKKAKLTPKEKRQQKRANTRNHRSLVSPAHSDGISGYYDRRYFTRTEKTVRSIWLGRKIKTLTI